MKLFLVVVMLLFPVAGWGADGYKNLKWGMSKDAVKKSKLCTFADLKSPNKDIVIQLCKDFVFDGSKTEAFVTFVNNKLLRFGFVVPHDKVDAAVESIGDKYGEPSSLPDSEDAEAVYKLPNKKISVGYDKDTVWIVARSDESNEVSTAIWYTHPDYNAELLKSQKRSMKNDL